MRSRHGLKASFWILVLFWVHPHPVKDFCMTQGLPFTWHYNSEWIQHSAFCSHPRSFSTYNILLQQFLMRSAQGSWQYPTYRRGSDAQAEDLGTKPREKGRGGGVWMSAQRSIGGLLPPRSSASAKGDNSPGGLRAPLGLPSPWQWTWDRSATISCPHRELIPPKPRPCLFPLTQAPEGPQETKTQLCIPAGHCLLPRAFPSICQNIWRN